MPQRWRWLAGAAWLLAALGAWPAARLSAQGAGGSTPPLLAVTRHALQNNGRIEGSCQQLSGEGVNLNSGAVFTGDFLVPGTPAVQLNGSPSWSGQQTGAGSASPTGYQITVNSGVQMRYLVKRTDPTTLAAVPAPPAPAGTRQLNLNSPGDAAAVGNWATVRDVTLNSGAGNVTVPAGTYGTFNASNSDNTGFVFGTAGAAQPSVYNLQALTLNSNSRLTVLGPVILNVAGQVSVNSNSAILGSTANQTWLQLNDAGGGVTLNSGSVIYGAVNAPAGAINLNGKLAGTAFCNQLTVNSGGVLTAGTAPNKAPVVSAGAAQTITLPAGASLAGAVTDDGLPVGAKVTSAWSKASGPGAVTFANAAVLQTTASFSTAGTYVLQLSATDTALSSSATVTVTVIAQNQPPQVNAGAAQTIRLPAAAGLSGTATDDGLPVGSKLTVTWTQVSGPGAATFSAPTATATQASFPVAGTYVLQLSASDTALSSSSTVTVTVLAANQAPVVSAGAAQAVTLPAAANLAGTVTDDGVPVGAPLTSVWSKASGPGTVTFANPAAPQTSASFDQPGTYILQLSASDTQLSASAAVTVTVGAANKAPVVSAGANQSISLPASASLAGTVTDDGLPAGAKVTSVWTKASGPGSVTFANAAAPQTSAAFSAAGTYVLQLSASDTALSSSATVTVTVGAANQAPVVSAGTNQTITLPATAALAGSVTDDGLPKGAAVTSAWSKASGPGTVTFGNAASAQTSASFSAAGTYVLQLSASDTALTGSATVTATVIAQNQPPQVSAGAAQTIRLPAAATLAGTATDDGLPTGSKLTVAWSQVSGPGTATFVAPVSAATSVSFDKPGVYALRLTGNDGALTATSDVQITVLVANQAPVVSAGASQSISLPAAAALAGSVADDGLPTGAAVTSVWSAVSGPGTVTFGNAAAPQTSASFSAAGTYVLKLSASDTQLTGSATVTITVGAANKAPVVSAGAPQTITLPATAALAGTVTDDGLPAGAAVTSAWSKASGPGSVTFGNAAAPQTSASFSVAGTYVLQLSASDTALSTNATVTVTVIAQNQPPTVSAGAAQTVRLPAAATLAGTATDDGLPANSHLTVAWSQTSGPGTTAFGTPNAASTQASFSAPGTYVLQLSASDTQLTSTSSVTVTVLPANQAPVVSAGPAQTVTPPAAAALAGSVTDDGLPQGAAVTSVWSKLSGPGTVTFANPAAPQTSASFNEAGVYVLQLSASDTALSSSATVAVTVKLSNQPPQVSAGPAQTITLPASATLSGSVTDDGLPAGAVVKSAWAKVSGPGSVLFTNPNAPQTGVSFDQAGVYVLSLTGDDTQFARAAQTTVTVHAANQPPQVSAGPAQSVELGTPATLNGTATDDGLPRGGGLAIAWTQLGGPGTVTFSNPFQAATSAAFSAVGTYTLRLSASDSALTSTSDVQVTITPKANKAPVVHAGSAQTLQGIYSASLAGEATDDGLPAGSTLSTAWSAVSGPGKVAFADAHAGATVATFSEPGVYELRLTASDGALSASDDLVVTVDTPNRAPKVSAGPDQSVALSQGRVGKIFVMSDEYPLSDNGFNNAPADTRRFALNIASFFSPGRPGSFLAYSSNFSLSGGLLPQTLRAAGYTWTVGKQVDTSLAGLLKYDAIFLVGDYLDNSVLIDYVKAGGCVYLGAGTGTDRNSGLYTGDFEAADEAARWQTFLGAFGLAYQPYYDYGQIGLLPIQSNDLLFSGVSTLYFVNGSPVVAPSPGSGVVPGGARLIDAWRGSGVAGAYGQQGIASVALAGSVLDDGLPAGRPLTTGWTVVSGPGAVTFDNAQAPETTAHFSLPGAYVLRLTASDGELSGSAVVTIQITQVNQPPTVDAGPDLTLPLSAASAVTLAGSVADDGLPTGGSLSAAWTQVSGPAGGAAFANPGSAATSAAFTLPGRYVLRLTASDGALQSSAGVTVAITNGARGAQGPGGVFVTGHDSDWHAAAGLNNQAGAIHIVQRAVGYVTYDRPNPKLLLVSDPRLGNGQDPAHPGLGDPRAGLVNAGFSGFDVADHDGGSYGGTTLDLRTVDLSAYDAVVVASDGWLGQAELDVLIARAGDLARFINGGGGVVAFSEAGPQANGYTQHDQYRFLPFVTGIPGVDQPESNNQITPLGASLGLAGTDFLGNYSHNLFQPSPTLGIVDLDSQGRILSLAARGQNVTAQGVENQPPSVSAGPDLAVALNTPAALNGVVTDDGLPAGSQLTTLWQQISGPAQASFADPTAPLTQASFPAAGNYVLRLSASDGQLTGSADARIAVGADGQATLTITSPRTGTQLSAPANLTVAAGYVGSSAVSQVLFFANGQLIGTASAAPYTAAWTSVAAGDYTLQARASTAGGIVESAPLTVKVLPGAGALAGLRWEIPTYGDSYSCPQSSFAQTTFQGDANTVYDVAVRFRGLIEQRAYYGGTNDGAYWQVGGDDPYNHYDTYNVYKLTVSNPPQTYYVNRGQSNIDALWPVDYTKTIQAAGGATVTLTADSIEGSEIFNHTLRVIPGVAPAPLPFHGQFLQMDPVSVAASGAAVGPQVSVEPDQNVVLPAGANVQASVNPGVLSRGASLLTYWSQVSGPGIATFGQPSAAATNVVFAQPGTYVLSCTASQSGLAASACLTVTVQAAPSTAVNQAPVVTAPAAQSVVLGTPAVLGGSARDDGLPYGTLSLQWSQVSGPGSASFDAPQRAATSASFTAAGAYVLRLSASDGALSAQADTTVTVNAASAVNQPPQVSAGGSLSAVAGQTVALSGTVTDDGLPSGGALVSRWQQASGPAAVTVLDPSAPATRATFPAPGTYALNLSASDGALSASDNLTVTVSAAPGGGSPVNQPPTLSLGATARAVPFGQGLMLDPQLADDGLPNGTLDLSWVQLDGPDNAAFADASATPGLGYYATAITFPAAGSYYLRATATDGALSASADLAVTVTPGLGQPPTVSLDEPLPGQPFSHGQPIALSASAADPDGWVQSVGFYADGVLAGRADLPPGLAQNPDAPFAPAFTASWTGAAVGAHTLTAVATDNSGTSTTSAPVSITVSPAQPQVALSYPAAHAAFKAGDQVTLQASASPGGDGAAVTGVQFLVNGQALGQAAQAPYTAAWSVPAAGDYTLTAQASDAAGQQATSAAVPVRAVAAGADPAAPTTVDLTSPIEGQEVTAPIAVVGTVDGPSLASWKLEYRRRSSPCADWTTFAVGAGITDAATLGTFDPTLVPNGLYDLRLSALSGGGRTDVSSASVVVDGGMKVGRFTVAFNDLTVPLAGLPITVTRAYDSAEKCPGDFGVGWNLDVTTVRLEKNYALGDAWYADFQPQDPIYIPTYSLEDVGPHVVTITFPDGKAYRFQPTLTLADGSPATRFAAPIGSSEPLKIGFTALPGTQGKLAARGVPASLYLSDDAYLSNIGFLDAPYDGVPFSDATGWDFTTQDGRVFTFDAQGKLTQMADRSGNTLTFTRTGIYHSSGRSVQFTRDALDRISAVTDPMGQQLLYAYDAQGNLAQVTDRAGAKSAYTYDAFHDLKSLVDPRGVIPLRNDYDAGGRLARSTDAAGQTITYTHNVAGRVEAITDRLGHTTTHRYDEQGNVLSTTDAKGGVTSFTYDANNNKLTQTDPLGHTTRYAYDANGLLLQVADPLGHVTSFTYDGSGRALTVTDARGKVSATNAYDAAGNLLSVTDALGHASAYTYDAQGNRLTEQDALGSVTRHEYDAYGHETKTTDARGHATAYTYDPDGNRLTEATTRTRSDGTAETLTTAHAYDADGRSTQTTDALGGTTQTVYNAIGKPAQTVDALGRATSYAYDAQGQLLSTTAPDGAVASQTYDAEGRRLTSTDPNGAVTAYGYDELGRLTKTTLADGSSTQSAFDAAGRVASVTDANGSVTAYAYDDAGRRTGVRDALGRVSTYTYDEAGNQTGFTDALGHATAYVYDDQNQRTGTVFADGSAQATAYDAAGRHVAETDPLGRTTRFGYDALGRLVLVTDNAGQQTGYAYDELGNETSQTDANGHTTTYAYDGLGRRTARTLPAGQTEALAYDAAGNLGARRDFNGRTTTFRYDAANRLLARAPDPGLGEPTVSFTYAPAGQRLSMSDASGLTRYGYDARGRLTAKATPEGTLAYTYDAAGHVATMASSNLNGTSVAYGYDALGRLAAVNDAHTGQTSYAYDAAGNLAGCQYPNQTSATYGYDALNRLSGLSVAGASGGASRVLASYAYALNAAGQRTGVAELGGRTVAYGYDRLGRLQGEQVSGATGGSPNGQVSYTLDAVGNRLARASTLAGVPAGSAGFDADDRLAGDAYDANGNTRQGAGGAGLDTYDSFDRLAGRSGGAAGAVQVVYDGDGHKVRETAAGVTTSYLVDDLNPTGYAQAVEELTGGAVTRVYTWGAQLISQDRFSPAGGAGGGAGGWSASFYGFDGHGSVRLLTDQAGAVTDTYDYDAFGVLLKRQGLTDNRHLYCGEELDAALGLYNLRARLMDPLRGRFWSADSFEGNYRRPSSLNKYLYCENDPVYNADPSGHDTDPTDFWLDGIIVHRSIGADFVTQKPGRRLANYYPVSGIINRQEGREGEDLLKANQVFELDARLIDLGLKPDLVDFDTKEVWEIKTTRGYLIGLAELQEYLIILNAARDQSTRPWIVGTSYNPPSQASGLLRTTKVYPAVNGVIRYDPFVSNDALAAGAAVGIGVQLAPLVAKAVAAEFASIQGAFGVAGATSTLAPGTP